MVVDGKRSGKKLTGGVSRTETFILIGTEVVGYRGYVPGLYRDGGKINTIKNDRFTVDSVRVFDCVK